MEKKENKKNNHSQTGFAIACWILGILIFLIVFLVKHDDIIKNLKTTQFFERTIGITPKFIEEFEEKDKSAENHDEIVEEIIDLRDLKNSQVNEEKTSDNSKKAENHEVSNSDENHENLKVESDSKNSLASKNEESKIEEQTKSAETKSENKNVQKQDITKKTETVKIPMQNRKIYFVYIGEDGILSRKMVNREVPKNDSPLTTSINLLLEGPNGQESSKGFKSLIPANTKLKSASVKSGIAYLNFSEEFEFNSVGVDGYIGQLMQIVYTATEFPTVEGVQFLIEGEKREYLGSEGVWIGTPLSRSSF